MVGMAMLAARSSVAYESADAVAAIGRRRSQRVLFLCLAGSIALHALLFAALPAWVHDDEPLKTNVLDVNLTKPVPLPASEPPKPPPVESRPRPRSNTPSETEPRRTKPPEPQVAEKPEPRSAEPAFKLTPPPAEARGPAPEQKAESAPAARETPKISQPAFNAAYLNNPAPRYPLIARRNGEQGTVTLKVLVTREGVPASVNVEKTSGSRHLDSAALETVKTWRFVPARQGGQAVEAWVLVPIVFKLEGTS
jgi:periplasmic protein TonB